MVNSRIMQCTNWYSLDRTDPAVWKDTDGDGVGDKVDGDDDGDNLP